MSLIHLFTLGFRENYLIPGLIIGIIMASYAFIRLSYLFSYYGISKRNSLILRSICSIFIIVCSANVQSTVTLLIAYLFRYSNLLMSEKCDVDIGFGKNILPNNSVNRLFNDTKIFYTQGDNYKNLGLFFLIKVFDDEFDAILKSAIKFLKDRGFGRDISTGKGQFDYIIENNDNSIDIDNGNMFTTLSRFIPSEDDLKRINEYSFYEIDSKRGRDKSGEIRKQVRFFKEGSIFPNYQENYGKIFKSGNVNPAIEYGYAFPIRFNMELEE